MNNAASTTPNRQHELQQQIIPINNMSTLKYIDKEVKVVSHQEVFCPMIEILQFFSQSRPRCRCRPFQMERQTAATLKKHPQSMLIASLIIAYGARKKRAWFGFRPWEINRITFGQKESYSSVAYPTVRVRIALVLVQSFSEQLSF